MRGDLNHLLIDAPIAVTSQRNCRTMYKMGLSSDRHQTEAPKASTKVSLSQRLRFGTKSTILSVVITSVILIIIWS